MKFAILIQARMGSKRLPGKALLDIGGQPLLLRGAERARASQRAEEIVVATSSDPASDPIAQACKKWGLPCYRGPEKDLTTRLLGACHAFGVTVFARWTADNPLTDPQAIDEMLELLESSGADLIHNAHRRGYPYGTGAEVIRVSALERCDRVLKTLDERELVVSFLDEHPGLFKSLHPEAPPSLQRPRYFLTVDYPEDAILMGEIYRHFNGRNDVATSEVVAFLDGRPDLVALNARLHDPFPF